MSDGERVRIELRLGKDLPTRDAVIALFRRPELRRLEARVGRPDADGALECWIYVRRDRAEEGSCSLYVERPPDGTRLNTDTLNVLFPRTDQIQIVRQNRCSRRSR